MLFEVCCVAMAVERPVSADQAVVAQAMRYRPAIHAFLARRVSDRAEADDLTQEVFASLARRAGLESVVNMERYIFQVAANLLRDRARRAARRPRIECEGGADPFGRLVDEISPERALLGREAYARFVAALQALPERPRTIFILCRFEEMTGREVAARLGVSLRLVEKDLARALRTLREQMS